MSTQSRAKQNRTIRKKHCFYCGNFDDTMMTVDHFIPRSKKGTSNISNRVPCCPSCNTQKGGRMPNMKEIIIFKYYFPKVKLSILMRTYRDPHRSNTKFFRRECIEEFIKKWLTVENNVVR